MSGWPDASGAGSTAQGGLGWIPPQRGMGSTNFTKGHSAFTLGVGSVAFHPSFSSESAREMGGAPSSGDTNNAPSAWSSFKEIFYPGTVSLISLVVSLLSLALLVALLYFNQSYMTTKPPTLDLEASSQVPGAVCPRYENCSSLLSSLLDYQGYAGGASGPSAVAEGQGEAQGGDGGGSTWEGGEGNYSARELELEGARSVMLELSLLQSEKEYDLNIARRKQLVVDNPFLLNPDKPSMQVVYLIPTYPCGMEGHFGTWWDGGKWVCLRTYDSDKKPFVVSIGCNGETSFEKDIFERKGGFSHTFDFSLKIEQVEEISKFNFMKLYTSGLSGKNQLQQYHTWLPMEKFLTVPELLSELGTGYADILKIDCESCEYEVVQDMADLYTRDNVPFGQILMEIHGIDNTTRCMQLFRNLESLGYRLFHTEINGLYDLGYEIAYVHEKLVKPRGGIPT